MVALQKCPLAKCPLSHEVPLEVPPKVPPGVMARSEERSCHIDRLRLLMMIVRLPIPQPVDVIS